MGEKAELPELVEKAGPRVSFSDFGTSDTGEISRKHVRK